MIAGIRRTISGGALKSPQFRLLLGAGMAMQLGQWIQRVALLWTVYDLTGSAVQLAGLGFLSNIFVLVLSPFVGPLADKYGARRVLLVHGGARRRGRCRDCHPVHAQQCDHADL